MILFCINKLGVGGAERVFVKDANTFYQMGEEVFFCLLFGNEEDQLLLSSLKIKPENIFYAGAKSFYDFKAISSVSKFIKEKKIKTVYATLNEANIFSRLLKIFSSKVSVLIREANIADPKPIRFKILDLFLNLFVKKIVCVSDEVKTSLLKYEPFYKNKMIVLPNGVELPEGQVDLSVITLPVKFVTVGSLTPKKGHKYLINACKVVQEQNPDSFTLNIVGDGVERRKLENLVKEKGLSDKISFSGLLSSDRVKQEYLGSHVFVLSSLWEGSPNVLLEAMSYGLVCISTKVSGARGMIEDGQSGFLVPEGDSSALAQAMLDLIKNKAQFTSLGSNARKRIIENFAYPIYIKKLDSILN